MKKMYFCLPVESLRKSLLSDYSNIRDLVRSTHQHYSLFIFSERRERVPFAVVHRYLVGIVRPEAAHGDRLGYSGTGHRYNAAAHGDIGGLVNSVGTGKLKSVSSAAYLQRTPGVRADFYPAVPAKHRCAEQRFMSAFTVRNGQSLFIKALRYGLLVMRVYLVKLAAVYRHRKSRVPHRAVHLFLRLADKAPVLPVGIVLVAVHGKLPSRCATGR